MDKPVPRPSDAGVPDAGPDAGPAPAPSSWLEASITAPSGDVTLYAGDALAVATECRATDGVAITGEVLVTPDLPIDEQGRWVFPQAGTYSIALTCEDAQGRSATTERIITVLPSPRVLYTAAQDADDLHELFLMDLAEPATTRKLNPEMTALGGPAYRIGYAPGGQALVATGLEQSEGLSSVWALFVDGPPRRERLAGPNRTAQPLPSPTGAATVAFGETLDDVAFTYHDLRGATAVSEPIDLHMTNSASAAVSLDGRYFLYAKSGETGALHLRDDLAATDVTIPLPIQADDWGVRILPDAQHFQIVAVTAGMQQRFYTGSVDAPEVLTPFNFAGDANAFVRDAAGSRLLVSATAEVGRDIYSTDLGGGDARRLFSAGITSFTVCDGALLALVTGSSFDYYRLGTDPVGPVAIQGPAPRSVAQFAPSCALAVYDAGDDAALVHLDTSPSASAHRVVRLPATGAVKFSNTEAYAYGCAADQGRVYAVDGTDTGYRGRCVLGFAPDDSFFVTVESVNGGARPAIVRLSQGQAGAPEPLVPDPIWPLASTIPGAAPYAGFWSVDATMQHVALSAVDTPLPNGRTAYDGIYEVTLSDGSVRRLSEAPAVPVGDVERFASVPGRELVLFSGDLVQEGIHNLYAVELQGSTVGNPLQQGDDANLSLPEWEVPAHLGQWLPVDNGDGIGFIPVATGAGSLPAMVRWQGPLLALGLDGEDGFVYAREDAGSISELERRTIGDTTASRLAARPTDFGSIRSVHPQLSQRRLIVLGRRAGDTSDQLYAVGFGGPPTAISMAERGAVSAVFVEDRGEQVAYVQCDDVCRLQVARPGHPEGFSAEVDPNGVQVSMAAGSDGVAYLDRGELHVARGDHAGTATRVDGSLTPAARLMWSDDGRWLTYCDGPSACDWLVDLWAPDQLLSLAPRLSVAGQAPNGIVAVAFSPAHDRLLLQTTTGSVIRHLLVRLGDDSPGEIVHVGELTHIEFDPAGRYLLVRARPATGSQNAPMPASVLPLNALQSPIPVGPTVGDPGTPIAVARAGWVR